MISVLQKHSDCLHPVASFSAKHGQVATNFPKCLRAIAATEKALLEILSTTFGA